MFASFLSWKGGVLVCYIEQGEGVFLPSLEEVCALTGFFNALGQFLA